MYPDVDGGDGQKRFEAGRNALPTDHQAAVLLLEPRKRPLSLESWDHVFDRSAPGFLGLPDTLRDLCPDTPLPELLSQRFRIIPLIRRDHFETCAGATPCARVHLNGIEQ